MGRGFLSGSFWGGILGLVVLFLSNQALDRQSLSFPKPEAAAIEVPGGSEFNQARPETDPIVPKTDTRPEGEGVAGVPLPEDGSDTPPEMDTAALEVPVPATSQDALETLGEAPDETLDATEPETATDAAVGGETAETLADPESPGAAPETSTAEVAAPQTTSETEDAPVVSSSEDAAPADSETEIASVPDTGDAPTQPVAGSAPQVSSQVEAPGGPSAPQVDDEASLPWLSQNADSIDKAPDAPGLPQASVEPSLPPAGTETPEAPVVAETVEAAPSTDDAVAAAVEEALAEAVDPDDPPAVDPATADTETAGVTIENDDADAPTEASESTDGSTGLQPVETLTERDQGSASDGSLPVVRRLGDSSSEEAEEEIALLETDDEETVEVGEGDAETALNVPALQAFGSAFEAPGGVPLMSIILVQDGPIAMAPETLEILPPHVAFAVDASSPDASALAQTYRAAGREVVMIPNLPAGATPQDIEQALAVNFERIPEAVALMDVSGSSFQSDRAAVAQVVDVVAASGHGLITFPRGLNTAHQQAQRAGVPTGLIFRNLDNSGETQEQIRRSLDRAAFRARQDEAVILVGTTGATTLSALTEWVLGNRATTVAIAPVSAALGG